MDQMADEMAVRGDGRDKGGVNTAEESSTRVRGERITSETQVSDWRLGASVDDESREPGGVTDTQRLRESDGSSFRLLSSKTYLRSSTAGSSTDSLSSSAQTNMGVDCAGFVLNCLFCRFYDMILMVPDSCERAVHRCFPNYKQIVTEMESTPSDEDSHVDWDCGLFSSCHDLGDCLELVMEVSEVCYH